MSVSTNQLVNGGCSLTGSAGVPGIALGTTGSYDIAGSAGSVFVMPGSTDTGTVTLNSRAGVSHTAYAIAPSPYLTVPAGATIRINGSAWSKDSFGAALVRISKTAVEASSNLLFNWRTVTGVGNDPYMALGVQGATGSVISSAANRLVSVYGQGAGFIRASSAFSSTYVPTTTPTMVPDGPYGSDSSTSDTANSAWCWIFWRSTTATTSAEYNLTAFNNTQLLNTATVGHMFVAPGALVVANTNMMNMRLDNTMSVVSATAGAYDWILGTTTAYTVGTAYDIARIILLSRAPTALDMVLMMQGMDPTDMGLVPAAGDFVGTFGSVEQLAASTGKTIVYGGTAISASDWHTGGGPMLIRKLGAVNPTRVVNVSAGGVL